MRTLSKISILLSIFLLVGVNDLLAQRMGHAPAQRGGGGGNRSVNGGVQRSNSRPATRPSTNNYTPKKNTPTRDMNRHDISQKPKNNINTNVRPANSKVGAGNKINNSGNRINIDNSKNVNVRVNNNHYNHYYNGHRGYYPYHYHPYHPYYYGPVWHPFGFFVAVMATTAIIVSIENQHYYYDQGVYYTQVSGGYNVVPPPVNITIVNLPAEGVEAVKNEDLTYYYYAGTFYKKSADGYTVIPAPDGAVVSNIPEGAEEIEIDGSKYVVYNETYFQPLSQDGNDVYQVVEMEPAE